jgi:hypothetical protein
MTLSAKQPIRTIKVLGGNKPAPSGAILRRFSIGINAREVAPMAEAHHPAHRPSDGGSIGLGDDLDGQRQAEVAGFVDTAFRFR